MKCFRKTVISVALIIFLLAFHITNENTRVSVITDESMNQSPTEYHPDHDMSEIPPEWLTSPVDRTYFENFTTTTYRRSSSTTATGWGNGQVTPPKMNLTLAGLWSSSGLGGGVAIEGDYAYVGVGAAMKVLDITDPVVPEDISSITFSGQTTVLSILIRGDAAYVVEDDLYGVPSAHGLRILNISNSEEPKLIGSYNTYGYTRDMCIYGNYAYLPWYLSTWGLDIINITTPSRPQFLTTYTLTGAPTDVFVRGHYLFLVGNHKGLIFDINNPTAPSQVGMWDSPGSPVSIVVEGDYAYVAAYNSGLSIVDISSVSSPTPVTTVTTHEPAEDVVIEGNIAYVASGYAGLVLFDITDPHHPVETARYDSSEDYTGYARKTAISGEYAYVVSSDGLQVVKIKDVVSPVIVNNYKNPYSGGFLSDLEIEGNLAYLAYTRGISRPVNITIPQTPQLTGGGPIFHDPYVYSLAMSGDVLYTLISVQFAYDMIEIIDFSDPENPVDSVAYLVDLGLPDAHCNDLAVDGDILYLVGTNSTDNAFLWAFNIGSSNWNNPLLIGIENLSSSECFSCDIEGDLIFLASGTSGLQIYNISHPGYGPSNIIPVGNCPSIGQVLDVSVAGNYAYVTTNTSGLQVVNITNPLYPTPISTCATIGEANAVSIEGDIAFIADGPAGLTVINITDPCEPEIIHNCDTLGYAMNLQIEGNYAFIADGFEELVVMEVMKYRFQEYLTPSVVQSTIINPNANEPISIINAALSCNQTLPPETRIDYSLSTDNGSIWQPIIPGTYHVFTMTGRYLCWRAVLSTTNLSIAPSIFSVNITYQTQLIATTLMFPSDGFRTANATPTFNWLRLPGMSGFLLEFDRTQNFNSGSLTGFLTPSANYTLTIGLDDGYWYWRVAPYDSLGGIGEFSEPRLIIIDTTPPSLSSLQTYHSIEFGQDFIYDANASDISGIDAWIINDTLHFAVDGAGVIWNIVPLSVGEYPLAIQVNDTLGNQITTELTISVCDTTAPVWDILISDKQLEYNEVFRYDLNATDLSGIDHYWVNHTFFAVSDTGVIDNITLLLPGVYHIEIRAYDPYDNYCWATFTLTVYEPPTTTAATTTTSTTSTTTYTSTTATTSTTSMASFLPLNSTLIIGGFIGLVFVSVIIVIFRRRT